MRRLPSQLGQTTTIKRHAQDPDLEAFAIDRDFIDKLYIYIATYNYIYISISIAMHTCFLLGHYVSANFFFFFFLVRMVSGWAKSIECTFFNFLKLMHIYIYINSYVKKINSYVRCATCTFPGYTFIYLYIATYAYMQYTYACWRLCTCTYAP